MLINLLLLFRIENTYHHRLSHSTSLPILKVNMAHYKSLRIIVSLFLVIALLADTIAAHGLKGSEAMEIPNEDRQLFTYPFNSFDQFWRFLLCFWNFGYIFKCPAK
jgi:ABC-type uncharacterized transport system permease subunit